MDAPVPILTRSVMRTGAKRGCGRPAVASSWTLVSRALLYQDIERPDAILMFPKRVTVEQSFVYEHDPISKGLPAVYKYSHAPVDLHQHPELRHRA